MERDFQPLPIRELGANAGFRRPIQPQSARVSAESPGAQVMTDLTRLAPATIRPQAPLAGANQFMITRGVRLLLVTDDHENVLGVITATDILSERPMRAAIDRGMRRDELTVGDVMTGAEQVEVIAYADVEGARVGHVLEAYARQRNEFRAKVMLHKKRRTVHLGAHLTLQFEDELTIRYQVQEMLRIERIFEEDGIQGELDAYNPLLPDGSNWKATMLIEYPDAEERKRMLARMKGIERQVWVQVDGCERVDAIAD